MEDAYRTPATQHRAADRHPDAAIPLVVDLDGTLIRADMLVESALRLLRDCFHLFVAQNSPDEAQLRLRVQTALRELGSSIPQRAFEQSTLQACNNRTN